MWMVDPEYLCREHLLGEHNELHKIVGHIQKGNLEVVQGHAARGQVDTSLLRERHDELAREMSKRGYSHDSPMEVEDNLDVGEVDVERNLKDLESRCDRCRKRIEDADNDQGQRV